MPALTRQAGWRGLEIVQAFEVPEQVNPAPGVQGAGQVPVPGVAVAEFRPAGQQPATACRPPWPATPGRTRATSASWLAGAWTSLLLDDPGCVAAMREFQQRYPLVWSEDTGGR